MNSAAFGFFLLILLGLGYLFLREAISVSAEISEHRFHIRRQRELEILGGAFANCRLCHKNPSETACGACYRCCGRCRSHEANRPERVRAYRRAKLEAEIRRLEKENNQ